MDQHPYRKCAAIEKYVDNRKKFGIIHVPQVVVVPPPPPHKCKLPKPSPPLSLLKTILNRIFKGLTPLLNTGDLWRCEDCSKVYRYRVWDKNCNDSTVKGCIHDCNTFCTYWAHSSVDEWVDAGGAE